MKEENSIDKHLKGQIAGFEVQPQLDSFDAVMSKMRRKKRRRALWIFAVAGIAMLIVLPVQLLFFNSENRQSAQNNAKTLSTKPTGINTLQIADEIKIAQTTLPANTAPTN